MDNKLTARSGLHYAGLVGLILGFVIMIWIMTHPFVFKGAWHHCGGAKSRGKNTNAENKYA